MSRISELLHSRLPKGWSVREVARQVEKRGHTASLPTVTALFAGKVKRPTIATLEAVADVLPVTVNEMLRALDMPGVERKWQPPEEAHLLAPEVQDSITQMIRAIAATQGGQHGRAAADAQKNNVTPIRGGTPDTMDKAAWGHTAPGRLQAHEDEQRGEESQDPGE